MRPADAIEPLSRVIAIAGDDLARFGVDDPRVMLAFCKASDDRENDDHKEALLAVMKARGKAGAEPSLSAARAWYHLTVWAISNRRYGRAERYSNDALENYRAIDTAPKPELTQALIVSGIARIAGGSRSEEDLVEAADYFAEAVGYFPPQDDIETFDQDLATAIAWYAATGSASYTDARFNNRLQNTLLRPRKEPDLADIDGVKWRNRPPEESCVIEWEGKRTVPKFPRRDAARGYIGAVYVGYHLSPSGVPADIKVLAEVPAQSKFAENAVKTLSKWHAKPFSNPECSRNHTTIFRYVLE